MNGAMAGIGTAIAVADFVLNLFGGAAANRQRHEQEKRQRSANLATAWGVFGQGTDTLQAQNIALTDTGLAVGEGTNRQIYQDTRTRVEDDVLAALGLTRGSSREDMNTAFFGSGAGGSQADELYTYIFGDDALAANRERREREEEERRRERANTDRHERSDPGRGDRASRESRR